MDRDKNGRFRSKKRSELNEIEKIVLFEEITRYNYAREIQRIAANVARDEVHRIKLLAKKIDIELSYGNCCLLDDDFNFDHYAKFMMDSVILLEEHFKELSLYFRKRYHSIRIIPEILKTDCPGITYTNDYDKQLSDEIKYFFDCEALVERLPDRVYTIGHKLTRKYWTTRITAVIEKCCNDAIKRYCDTKQENQNKNN